MNQLKLWAALTICAVLAACGGGGGGGDGTAPTQQNTSVQGNTTISQVIATPGSNAATITVAAAPAPSGVVVANVPMVNVVICSPSQPTRCATITNVQVDTGSSGFRVLKSVLDSAMSTWATDLPAVKAPNGTDLLGECMTFADGTAFGGIHKANLTVAGETATSLNIEVIGDTATPQPTNGTPGSCESLTNQVTPQDLHANGVLGVGTSVDDCSFCHNGTNSTPMYFTCVSNSSCTRLTGVSLDATRLVGNPVAQFPVDNNGVILELPAVASTGAATATGVLVFGIGTQSNNGLGSAKVFGADATYGYITTSLNGTSYPKSFFDSGSNSIFFPASLTMCSGGVFYCPASPQQFTATLSGTNGINASLDFTVANAQTLTNSGNFAFNNQAGAVGTFFQSNQVFDWGLPAFYGRNVYTAITGKNAGGVTGPYYAF